MAIKDKSIGAAFCDAAALIGGNAKLGIICAMDVELRDVLAETRGVSEEEICGFTFYEGILENTKVVLVKCGIGKVNAARGTQVMIDKYRPSYIINSGVSGALNPGLRPMDIVVGSEFVQHDFDLSPLGYAKGNICTDDGKDITVIKADKNLVEHLYDVSLQEKKVNDDAGNVMIGRIASGDQFINTVKAKTYIRENFGGDTSEMESAAIAQVASCAHVPFAVLRVISDMADGSNDESYEVFEKKASKLSSDIIIRFTKRAPDAK